MCIRDSWLIPMEKESPPPESPLALSDDEEQPTRAAALNAITERAAEVLENISVPFYSRMTVVTVI